MQVLLKVPHGKSDVGYRIGSFTIVRQPFLFFEYCLLNTTYCIAILHRRD